MAATLDLAHPDPARTDLAAWRHDGLLVSARTRRGEMTAFRNDRGALTGSLLRYGEWAEREIRFCTGVVAAGDTVIDAGAYIGTHALAFAEAVGPTGRVHCFEAQPASYALLAHNLAVNGVRHVVAANAVVGAADTTMDLRSLDVAASSSFGSTVAADADASAQSARVRVTTLDALALTACALVKIDVEGMEHEVLDGASRLLATAAPLIYAECNSVDGGSRVTDRLRAHGYTVWMHVADAFNPDNWRGYAQDIFSGSREAAVVGVPDHLLSWARHLTPKQGENFFEIATLDDLVAGMLLKPQYPREVLRFTSPFQTAARHG